MRTPRQGVDATNAERLPREIDELHSGANVRESVVVRMQECGHVLQLIAKTQTRLPTDKKPVRAQNRQESVW